jgi:SAM-dependent methyltransferase
MNNRVNCRFCGGSLAEFVDLGMSPLCESYLAKNQLNSMEPFYPLAAYVCRDCLLVQLRDYVAPEHIFTEYAYFSAYSDAWLDHARRYVETMTERLGLGPANRVIELGSNDGYLLQFFAEKGIPVLGIDPAANVASAAENRGVSTLVKFFGVETSRELAEKGIQGDLVLGNNVLAQVADLNSFVEGIRIILKPRGVCTIEFPHLLKTIAGNQFDQLPRTLFVFCGTYRREDICGSRYAHIRHRGAVDTRWLVAHLRMPRRRRNPPYVALSCAAGTPRAGGRLAPARHL